MNILVPDSWLREYLKTKATQKQIKEYVSLCGPSIERLSEVGKETIYDIEVTGNRPDSMSILGIAREAAAILPRFGIDAKFINDPYAEKVTPFQARNSRKALRVQTDPTLNPRFTAIILDGITVKPSPSWIQKRLELTGIRAINNVVDITNYIMRLYGQPVHAFDFDAIRPVASTATMILRASKKGEQITTLDGATHTLLGDDIVIEDSSGRLIDLCGIMGGSNSHITDRTKTIILFMQTYDPVHIRRTSMRLAQRTEAAGLFEKSLDTELVMPSMIKGIDLMQEVTDGNIASKLYDIYPEPYKPYTVSVARSKVDAYIGAHLSDKEISYILTSLGFSISPLKVTAGKGELLTVGVPSFRRDVTIDVDIVEEIARIYGYHNIFTKLPDTEPPVVIPDPTLAWEEEIKIRLRDWGYTELYTYSMISTEFMDVFGLDKSKAYQISNPLSNEWVYMRPSLLPSVLAAVNQNIAIRSDFMLFELSMIYQYRQGNLPQETPHLTVAWSGSGDLIRKAKGLAEALFELFGIPFPKSKTEQHNPWYQPNRMLKLGDYGVLGEIETTLLEDLTIKKPVVVLDLDVSKLVAHANPQKTYVAIPKYPPIIEDFSFTVEPGTTVGSLMEELKKAHPLIANVSLLDTYKTTRTFRVTYLDRSKNLTDEDVRPVREKLTVTAQKLGATLKT